MASFTSDFGGYREGFVTAGLSSLSFTFDITSETTVSSCTAYHNQHFQIMNLTFFYQGREFQNCYMDPPISLAFWYSGGQLEAVAAFTVLIIAVYCLMISILYTAGRCCISSTMAQSTTATNAPKSLLETEFRDTLDSKSCQTKECLEDFSWYTENKDESTQADTSDFNLHCEEFLLNNVKNVFFRSEKKPSQLSSQSQDHDDSAKTLHPPVEAVDQIPDVEYEWISHQLSLSLEGIVEESRIVQKVKQSMTFVNDCATDKKLFLPKNDNQCFPLSKGLSKKPEAKIIASHRPFSRDFWKCLMFQTLGSLAQKNQSEYDEIEKKVNQLTSWMESIQSPTGFLPPVQVHFVAPLEAFYNKYTGKMPQSDFHAEWARLASFQGANFSGRVWVTRFAAAGFYYPDKCSSVLRCAFCDSTIEMDTLSECSPMEHHSTNPVCPLVRGESENQSVEQSGQTTGRHFIQALLETIGGKDSSLFAETLPGKHNLLPSRNGEKRAAEESNASVCQSEESSSPYLSQSGKQASLRPGSQPTVQFLQSARLQESSVQNTAQVTSNTCINHSAQLSILQEGVTSNPWAVEPGASGTTSRLLESMQPSSTTNSAPFIPSQTIPSSSSAPASQTTSSSAPASQTTSSLSSSSASQTTSSSPSAPTSQTISSSALASQATPSSAPPARQVVTYSQLGIYTQEPKRPDLAIVSVRVNTFTGWPHADSHPPEDMAEAGFYYVGQSDLVRCFYCKGGLKSWTGSLQPWVEHARYYPRCPFVGQVKGQDYVDAVLELKERQEAISAHDVEVELQQRQRWRMRSRTQVPAAVVEGTVGEAAAAAAEDESDCVMQIAKEVDELQVENKQIESSQQCKICQTNEVNILFLPCGHLLACAQCAPALRTCAICRQRIKGRVRVLAQDAEGDSEHG